MTELGAGPMGMRPRFQPPTSSAGYYSYSPPPQGKRSVFAAITVTDVME